jgi:hypothetical protein
MAGTALIAASGATLSLALFTSTAVANANGFTTGTIVIGITPVNTIFTANAMMPGDSVPAGPVAGQVVTVANSGTAQLRYAITGIATNAPLAALLVITVKQPDGNAGASCALGTGTTLNTITAVATTTTNLVGNPATGAQAGDRVLAGGVGETLCFKATLPLATLNTAQGLTTNITISFLAEQTANNP